MKIAVVDDSLTIRELIKYVLNGIEVDIFENPSLIKTVDNYNLIITDLNMPVENGFEFTKRIRLSGFTKPILLLTTENSQEVKQKAREVGCTGWIEKPFNPDDLKKVITRLIGFQF